jgi:hypothetical protein
MHETKRPYQFLVCLLDFVIGCASADAQDVVVVFAHDASRTMKLGERSYKGREQSLHWRLLAASSPFENDVSEM